MSQYASHVSTKQTPQSEPIPGEPMIPNSSGGFVFSIDDWKRLDRFLLIGNDGGTYYAAEKELTIQNAQAVIRCVGEDAIRVISRIVDLSTYGRAPKNDPAIFALALCIANADGKARQHALDAIPSVCRIGTHLFQLMGCLKHLTKWNRSLRRAIGNWYLKKTDAHLAVQLVKYQNRCGYTHKDVLRLSHPKPETDTQRAMFAYATGKEFSQEQLPEFMKCAEAAKTADESSLCEMIRRVRLPRESVPTPMLNSIKVWDALLDDMPLTAMVRNLGKMSSIGLASPLSDGSRRICLRLADSDALKNSRLHPISILLAMKVYAQGHGDKGSLSWSPVPRILDALNDAFYNSFSFIEPTGKRFLLGIDVSGSMSSPISASTPLSSCEVAASMAMCAMRCESQCMSMAFSHEFKNIPLSRSTRLDDAVRLCHDANFGGTDCALPMLFALQHKIPVDMFVVYTDSETWFGNIHPSQAIHAYRDKMGIPAKCAIIGLTATNFSIADPADAGMMDCVGFDSSLPAILSEFARA